MFFTFSCFLELVPEFMDTPTGGSYKSAKILYCGNRDEKLFILPAENKKGKFGYIRFVHTNFTLFLFY